MIIMQEYKNYKNLLEEFKHVKYYEKVINKLSTLTNIDFFQLEVTEIENPKLVKIKEKDLGQD
ncbi:hypothetical protein [Spiroplasma sp. ChiS]|uniref:hypothetical protein n=1 Tax=Spiroplasma sp. ChiS TaxID=2099885 RepID=UPI000CFA2FBB|nr:hypothetical protein [Spiroplasma sp. ChiS]